MFVGCMNVWFNCGGCGIFLFVGRLIFCYCFVESLVEWVLKLFYYFCSCRIFIFEIDIFIYIFIFCGYGDFFIEFCWMLCFYSNVVVCIMNYCCCCNLLWIGSLIFCLWWSSFFIRCFFWCCIFVFVFLGFEL